MVNIWEYAYERNVRITCATGEIFDGDIIDISDAEEMDDSVEDELALETAEGKVYELKQGEILKIERLNRKG